MRREVNFAPGEALGNRAGGAARHLNAIEIQDETRIGGDSGRNRGGNHLEVKAAAQVAESVPQFFRRY